MDEFFDALPMMDGDDGEPTAAAETTRRAHCDHCDRPQRVCICAALPDPPITSAIRVVVLVHPKEFERKVTTVPLAALSLAHCDVLVGRDLGAFLGTGGCPALDAALASGHAEAGTTAVLFPGNGAFDLSDVLDDAATGDACGNVDVSGSCACVGYNDCRGANAEPGDQATLAAKPRRRMPPLPQLKFLLVVDGTWQFAREMFERNCPHLQGCTQVQFSRPFGLGTAGRSEYVRRAQLKCLWLQCFSLPKTCGLAPVQLCVLLASFASNPKNAWRGGSRLYARDK